MSIWINDTDLESLGLIVDNATSGWRDLPQHQDAGVMLPGTLGQLVTSPEPQVWPRQLVIAGAVQAATVGELERKVDTLKALFLSGGEVEVRFSTAPDRVHYARVESVQVPPLAPVLVQTVSRFSATLRSDVPLAFERAGLVVSFAGGPAELELGTGPSAPVIRISGPVTDPVVTYRDAWGREVARLEIDADLDATEYLLIDCARQEVTDQSGAWVNEVLSAGSDFPVFHPQDAVEGGPWPTIEVSPAPAAAEALYRRSYV